MANVATPTNDGQPRPVSGVRCQEPDPRSPIPDPRLNVGRQGVWAALAVVLGATLIIGSVSLVYPFGRDQGIHAYIADAALHGVTMYKDILMGVLLMTVIVHLLALLFFGHSMASLRLLDLLWTMATAGFIFLFVVRAFRRRWLAAAAGILYPFFYYNYNFWHSAQNDGFLNLPVAAAMAVLAYAQVESSELKAQSPRSFNLQLSTFNSCCLAGLLIGFALFFKYTILLLLPGLALAVLWSNGWRSPRAWRSVIGLAIGCLASAIVVFLIMAISGALPGFIEGQTGLAMPYSGIASTAPSLWSRFLQLVQSFTRPPDNIIAVLLGGLGLIPAIAILLRPRAGPPTSVRTAIGLTLIWLAAASFSVVVQGKYFYYHYLPLLPPLAVLGALALDLVFEPLGPWLKSSWLRVGLAALVGLGAIICTGYVDRYRDLGGLVTGSISYSDYLASSRFITNDFSLVEQSALADYLEEETAPTDHVFIWGLDPLIDFLARRQTGSRFIYNFPLVSAWARPEYRDELLKGFQVEPPEVFIATHADRLPWVTGHNLDSYEALMDIADLRDFVAENYELETRIGHYDVLRRTNSDHAPPAAGLPAALITQDLREALAWMTSGIKQQGAGEIADPEAHRAILWPAALPDGAPSALRGKLISHRLLNRELWLQDTTVSDLLPALSVWIKGDVRPFARQEPFKFQNEGQNFIAGEYRFTLLYECRNGLVSIYDLRPKSGSEALQGNDR